MMSIWHNNKQLVRRFRGTDEIVAAYRGTQQVYSTKIPRANLGLESALTGPFRVMFLGSSTTAGSGAKKFEDYVHNFTGHLLTDTPAQASHQVRQGSGTVASPTATGFHFLNAGVGGANSLSYFGSGRLSLATSFVPHLAIHMIGSNDYHEQRSLAAYKDGLRTAIESINGLSPGGKHVLVHSYKRTDTTVTTIPWEAYGQALREVASEYSNAHFVDVSGDFAALSTSEYLSGDKVHATVNGYELLAKFIAKRLGLRDRSGEIIWGMDAGQFELNEGTLASSIPPVPGSLEMINAQQPTAASRPRFRNRAEGKWFDFDGTDDYMDVIGGFAAAHGMPVTVYLVVESLGGTTGGDTQPFFSRSVNGDSGWWWVWREKAARLLKAAHSSAWGSNTPMGDFGDSERGIIAVTMFSNRQGRMWINNRIPMKTHPDSADYAGGPWMKSVRLGSNSTAGNFSAMKLREISFEHASGNDADVVARMEALADKHGITLAEGIETVYLTGTSGSASRDQLRSALSALGLSHTTVSRLPFALDTTHATILTDLFIGMRALEAVPYFSLDGIISTAGMFRGCWALKSIPMINTSSVTNASFMFDDARALESVPALDMSSCTNTTSMFGNCGSLTSAPLKNLKTSLNMSATKLTPQAAEELIAGLSTVTSATLTLPTTAQGANISVAIARGWTVVGVT